MTTRKTNNNSSLAELFQIEVESQSHILLERLLKIESGRVIQLDISELLRAAHSLKGAARLVKNPIIEKISHVMEEYFVSLQKHKKPILYQKVTILLQFIDLIARYTNMDSGKNFSNHDNNDFDQLKNDLLNENTDSNIITDIGLNQDTLGHSALIGNPISPQQKDSILKINKYRLTQLFNVTDELKIGVKRNAPFIASLIHLKRKNSEIQQLVDTLRKLMSTNQYERAIGNIRSINKKTMECQTGISDCLSIIEDIDRNMSNLVDKLNQETISIRLRPFSDGVIGFKRMIRDLAQATGKKVKLIIQGKNTEVDRDVLDTLETPLIQLIRNAVDHGIETPEERVQNGKDSCGTILLTAAYVAGMLSITVEDDGRGIDIDFLKKSIFDNKLAPKHLLERLSEQELLEFLFLPNFSTKHSVNTISGRGIGLDIVKNTIQDLHGEIISQIKTGAGMCFRLQVPITMSITSVVVIEIKNEIYAIPLVKVDKIITSDLQALIHENGKYYIMENNERVGVITGARIFNTELRPSMPELLSIVVVSDRLNRFGIIVDKLIGQREVAIRSLDSRLGKLKDINGVSLMEDGTLMLIIDVNDLVRSIDIIFARGTTEVINTDTKATDSPKLILVVDDSLTVRELVKNTLSKNGYGVTLAIDGIDGWNKIGEFHFDLIITDIDMPRLDGIQLISLIRNSSLTRTAPVMILSYKDRNIDKHRGLEAGADYYFCKDQFNDEKLLDAVQDLIGQA